MNTKKTKMIFLLSLLFSISTATEYYIHQKEEQHKVIYQLNECLFENEGNYFKYSKNDNSQQFTISMIKSTYQDEKCETETNNEYITIPYEETLDEIVDKLPEMKIYGKIQQSCNENDRKSNIINYYPTECPRGPNFYYKYSVLNNSIIIRENYGLDDVNCDKLKNADVIGEKCGCNGLIINTFVENIMCELENNNNNNNNTTNQTESVCPPSSAPSNPSNNDNNNNNQDNNNNNQYNNVPNNDNNNQDNTNNDNNVPNNDNTNNNDNNQDNNVPNNNDNNQDNNNQDNNNNNDNTNNDNNIPNNNDNNNNDNNNDNNQDDKIPTCSNEYEYYDKYRKECVCFENYKKVNDKCIIICSSKMKPNEKNNACICADGYKSVDGICIENYEEEETTGYYLVLIILILVCATGGSFFLWYSRKKRKQIEYQNEEIRRSGSTSRNNSPFPSSSLNNSFELTNYSIGNDNDDTISLSNKNQRNEKIERNRDEENNGELKDQDDYEDEDFEIEMTNVIVRDN